MGLERRVVGPWAAMSIDADRSRRASLVGRRQLHLALKGAITSSPHLVAQLGRIGGMFFSFAYLALRALLGLLVRSRRGPDIKDIELMVLRHELDVLRRQVERPTLRIVDRALVAAAACHLPRSASSVRLVTPRTLLRWHQACIPRLDRQVRAGASFCTSRRRPLSRV